MICTVNKVLIIQIGGSLKIKNRFIKFVFQRAHLVGTENIVDNEILEKIADSAISIPGESEMYIYIFGEWSGAIQISKKEYVARLYLDSIMVLTELGGILNCDNADRSDESEFKPILL